MIPRELFNKIRRIEIRTRGLVDNIFGGEYHSAFKGRGMAFSEVRPYQIGDEIRSIDWNVSARTGEAYVKVFEEEREQTLMMVVDVSGSENFGSRGKLKREIAAELCALVAFSAIKNNDKVGMLLFTDVVELFVPPKKGRRHVLRLVRDLFAHEATSRGTDIQLALDRILHVLNRRSIVLVVSDFLDEGYTAVLRALARRHDTLAVVLRDPLETALPPVGLMHLRDPETNEEVLLDTRSPKVRAAFEEKARRRQEETNSRLQQARVDTIVVGTEGDYIEPLIRFFRRRNKHS